VVGLTIDGGPRTNYYAPLCVPSEVIARACMFLEFCALVVVLLEARVVVFGTMVTYIC